MKEKKTFKQKTSIVNEALHLMRVFYGTSSMIKSPLHCQISSFLLTFSFSAIPCWTTRMTFLTQGCFDFTLTAARTQLPVSTAISVHYRAWLQYHRLPVGVPTYHLNGLKPNLRFPVDQMNGILIRGVLWIKRRQPVLEELVLKKATPCTVF